MNNIVSLLQEQEELVRESSKLPLYFESGSPGGVFDELTLDFATKKAHIACSLSESLRGIELGGYPLSNISESIDEHIKHLLVDLEKSPKNVYLLNNLGNSYMNTGEIDTAREYYQKAVAVDGKYGPARIGLAKSYMIQDRLEDAAEIYMKYIQEYPKAGNVLNDLAHIYIRTNDVGKAKELLDQLIGIHPSNANAYHNLGVIYLLQKDMNKAIASFRKATFLNENLLHAHNALGVCYSLIGNYKKAIKYLRIAHNINPLAAPPARNLAEVYQQDGNYYASVEFLEDYLKSNPLDWEAQNKLAYAHFRLGNYRRSLANLQHLATLKCSYVENRFAAILNNFGVIYVRIGNTDQAEKMFLRSMETSEKPNKVTYYNLVKLYVELGNQTKARELIEKSKTVFQEDNTLLILLALNSIYEEKYDEARDILIGIVEADSKSRDARLLLEMLMSEIYDEYDKSIDLIKEGLQKYESDQALWNNLAYCYLKKGRLEEATEILNTKVDWAKAGFPLYATKGLLQILRGKPGEGVRFYERAVALAPSLEFKNLVRQKKNIEMGVYYASLGNKTEAIRHLSRAMSKKSKSKVYLAQANKLLEKIKHLPEQAKLI